MKVGILASGSSGNAYYLGTPQCNLLIDAGISGKAIVRSLGQLGVKGQDLHAIIVTHEHKDHIHGVGVLSRKYNLPVYATEGTWKGMENLVGPIDNNNKRLLPAYGMVEFGDAWLEVFPISHDAREPIGVVFCDALTKVAVATDTGFITPAMRKGLTNSDVLIMEANHDPGMLWAGSYPYRLKRRIVSPVGHMSNGRAGEALAELIGSRTTRVVLAHLSKENNQPDLARNTVLQVLDEWGVTQQVNISVAPRLESGEVMLVTNPQV
ncbi:MAG: MBL fold metallo-hydrolase [Bacillota bacterium]